MNPTVLSLLLEERYYRNSLRAAVNKDSGQGKKKKQKKKQSSSESPVFIKFSLILLHLSGAVPWFCSFPLPSDQQRGSGHRSEVSVLLGPAEDERGHGVLRGALCSGFHQRLPWDGGESLSSWNRFSRKSFLRHFFRFHLVNRSFSLRLTAVRAFFFF